MHVTTIVEEPNVALFSSQLMDEVVFSTVTAQRRRNEQAQSTPSIPCSLFQTTVKLFVVKVCFLQR